MTTTATAGKTEELLQRLTEGVETLTGSEKWVRYLDVQSRFHELTGDLPPRRAPWSEGPLAEDAYARAFREQLERVKPAPKVPEWERIANELRLVAERTVHGELSVDQAATELDARTDRILEKRRWILSRRDRL